MDNLVLALTAYYVLVVVMSIHEQERCRKYYEENACIMCSRRRFKRRVKS